MKLPCLSHSLSDQCHAVRLQVGELRISQLFADPMHEVFNVNQLEIVQESAQILALVPRLSIKRVRTWGEHTEEESIAILDALAPIAGSMACCDLSDFR